MPRINEVTTGAMVRVRLDVTDVAGDTVINACSAAYDPDVTDVTPWHLEDLAAAFHAWENEKNHRGIDGLVAVQAAIDALIPDRVEQTVYLTAREARDLAAQLIAAAEQIDASRQVNA